MDDIDVLRCMYATLCGGADEALSLLEAGNVWEAKRRLRQALETAEELYIAGVSAEDEFTARRCEGSQHLLDDPEKP